MYTYGFFFLSYYPKRVSMNGCFLNESINLCCATPVVCDVIGCWREEAGLTGLNGGRRQETGNSLPKERNPRTQANPNVLPDGDKRSVRVGVWLPSLCRHTRPLDGSMCGTT